MPTESLDETIDRHIDLKLALHGKSAGELKEIILLQADRIVLYRAQLEKMVKTVDAIKKSLDMEDVEGE